MSEQKPEYCIAFRRTYPELEDEINALVIEGYEVVSYGPGSQDVYPSAVMRLRLDAELMPRLDEVLPLAQLIRNERVDLEARIKALESDNLELHKTKAHVDDLTALDGRVNRTQETLARGDARLAEAKELVNGLGTALARYQDTHAETHRFGDARAREFGECDATLLKASLRQTVQLATLERRLAALEGDDTEHDAQRRDFEAHKWREGE